MYDKTRMELYTVVLAKHICSSVRTRHNYCKFGALIAVLGVSLRRIWVKSCVAARAPPLEAEAVGASAEHSAQTGEVFSSRSLRGANCPRYNYCAARHIYASGNQIARYYSIPLSAKSAN